MAETERRVEFILTLKQDQAFEHLINEEDCSVLYGGAKGGGKTFLLCLWAFQYSKWLIDFWGLEKQKFPIPVGFMGRKRGVDFTKTTLETWKEIIPSQCYGIKEQDKEIIIEDKVKIFFGGLDDEDVVNKFNSAELVFLAVDQTEETKRSDLSVLQASLRRTHNGKTPPYKKLYTANPAECWLKEDFINNPKEHFYYIPALPSDNSHLPSNYIKTLEDTFSYDPILLAAYKDGNWDLLQSHATLITQSSLDLLKGLIISPVFNKSIVACDPAIGGDECVLYYMENGEIMDTLILHINDTQKIGAEAIAFMNKHHCDNFICDAIGIGKGVVDYVRASRKNVMEIISSEEAINKDYNANLRSEMWNFVATKIYRREIPYPKDEKLRRQLCGVKYKSEANRFELVRKDITKKELGESPDRADTFIYGIWGLSRLPDRVIKRERQDFSRELEPALRGYGWNNNQGLNYGW